MLQKWLIQISKALLANQGERDHGNEWESLEVGWQLSYFTVSKRSSAFHRWNTAAWFHHCVCVCERVMGNTWGPHTPKPSQTIMKTREEARSDKHGDVPNQRASDSETHKLTLSSRNQFHWALKILTAFSYCQSHLRHSIFRCLRTCGFALGLNAGQEFREPEHRAETYGFSFRFTEVHNTLTHSAIFVYSYENHWVKSMYMNWKQLMQENEKLKLKYKQWLKTNNNKQFKLIIRFSHDGLYIKTKQKIKPFLMVVHQILVF